MKRPARVPRREVQPSPQVVIDRREAVQRIALAVGITLTGPAIGSVLEKSVAVAGLADVDARARRYYVRAFLACGPDKQRALLEQLDRETLAQPASAGAVATEASRETERGGGGLATANTNASGRARNARARSFPPFFRTMKELTLLGYYTSQPGATKELRYLQVPGRFEGCVPFANVGRTWAT